MTRTEPCFDERAADSTNRLASAYLDAKEFVIQSGYADEIDWQWDVAEKPVTESDFLREGAWVILCTGFRESIVRRVFPEVTKAFLDWRSSRSIRQNMATCRRIALQAFANKRKIDAICGLATRTEELGFQAVRKRLSGDPVGFLQTFAFIGPVTARHLAKNLGASLAKPDRHLARVTSAAGFSSAQCLCEAISEIVGDPVPVVDVVIWRFATLSPDYVRAFQTSAA